MAAKYGTPYFSNYINSDMNPSDVRSMCPLFGKEKVLVRDDYSKEFHVSTVENLFKGGKKEKVYEVVLNGETKRARLNRFDNQKFYTVKTINGFSVVLSGTHANLVYGNTVKRTDELTTADYLPFNVVPLEGNGLTFDDGLMVGAFLGDGSLKDDYAVTYSVNGTTKTGIMSDIIRIAEDKFGAKVTVDNLGNCINVVVTSKMLRGLIEEYVTGKALNKELNVKCIGKSMSFREGILSGYMQTDGGTKNRMYSASKAAVESVATMLMSMGIPSKISVDNRDSETTLSDNPIYSIRPYDVENGQKSYGDVYIKGDGYMWFRIESIEEVDTTSAIGYCFEVLNDEEPYFTLPCGLVTHNCRLRLDLRELRKQNGGNFGAGENTGSIGVVTINLPQIAYTSTTEEEFFTELELAMNAAARSLDIKRRVVNAYLNKPQSAYPYTKAYLDAGLNNHFSTIGLVGMNEACLNAKWIGKDLTHQESLDWANRVLDFMREKLSDYQEMYGCLFNLEATPAESTCHTLARLDRRNYPSIITAGGKGAAPYYTNSTHLPVGAVEDVFDALDMEDPMQVKYTSGTVFHAFLGERLPDWKSAAKLVKTIAENYRLPYFTLSPTYSVCADHGYISGEKSTCPVCGKKTEVYSRITGYYRPVSNWNDGKAQEFRDRKTYCVDEDGKKHGIELEAVIDEPCMPGIDTVENTDTAESAGDGVVILSTHTCPKCKMAKAKMDAKGIAYESLFAEDEAGAELAKKLDVSAVPVMIVRKDGEEKVLRDFIEIMNWIG